MTKQRRARGFLLTPDFVVCRALPWFAPWNRYISRQDSGKDSNWKANSWNLSKPDWTGKLKLVTGSDKSCTIRLEEGSSTYAECIVDNYPGPC
ncbi:NECAPlike protein CG9132like, partial [Caligus rogercresseyi]